MKTSAEWAKELGCDDLWIEVQGSSRLCMEPIGEVSTMQEYVRSHLFSLRTTKASEPFITSIGYLDMTELRLGKAAACGVDLRDDPEFDDLYRKALQRVGQVTTSSVLFLDDLILKSEYQDMGLAKHLFGRALAYYDAYECVLASSDSPAFRADSVDGRPDSLGFEPISDGLFHSYSKTGIE